MESREKTRIAALTASVILALLLALVGYFAAHKLNPDAAREISLFGGKISGKGTASKNPYLSILGMFLVPISYYFNHFSLMSVIFFGSMGSALYFKFAYKTEQNGSTDRPTSDSNEIVTKESLSDRLKKLARKQFGIKDFKITDDTTLFQKNTASAKLSRFATILEQEFDISVKNKEIECLTKYGELENYIMHQLDLTDKENIVDEVHEIQETREHQTASSPDPLDIDSLKELAALKEKGHLTEAEFKAAKKRIL